LIPIQGVGYLWEGGLVHLSPGKGLPMWQLILFAACIVILAIVVSRFQNQRDSRADSTGCDRCGEKDFASHKEEKG
jgi:membrane protein implicated in regulation of membrane protease activity